MKQMLKDDLDLEKKAIKRYRQQIGLCEKLKDYTSRRLLEDILIEEESHADTGQSLLGYRQEIARGWKENKI